MFKWFFKKDTSDIIKAESIIHWDMYICSKNGRVFTIFSENDKEVPKEFESVINWYMNLKSPTYRLNHSNGAYILNRDNINIIYYDKKQF